MVLLDVSFSLFQSDLISFSGLSLTMDDNTGQTHPLYSTDRDQVDALLGHQGEPGPEQLTTAARLVMRYRDFPGADDIKDDIQKAVRAWGLDLDSLNVRCREIWMSGWRPGQQLGGDVGSGADVDDRDG